MLPGPVFNVELLVTARRPRYYVIRVLYGLGLLILVWQNYASWDRFNGEEFSPQQMTGFANSTFVSLVFLQGVMVVAMTPSLVAGVIANEKQRKTLHYLLASELTSAEVVLGKLMARMLHVAVFLAIGLPVMSLLSLFGGVDPNLVVLSVAGTFSCAFVLASLSVLCSTMAKRVREAITSTYLLEGSWLFLPLIAEGFMPWQYPTLYSYLRPAIGWALASTPWAPLRASFGLMRGAGALDPMVEATFWMMGLQVAAGVVFVALAVWKLRPVFRAQEGAKPFRLFGLVAGSKSRRLRFLQKKPVGDDAMLWKEMHTSRTSGAAQIVGIVVVLIVVGGVGYSLWTFALPSFGDAMATPYHQQSSARGALNVYLRFLVTIIGVIAMLATAVGGANSLTSEREDDTWISLVATPLDGIEIVRAKMIGVLWKMRWAMLLVACLWLLGLVCGAIHPLGVLFEAIELAAFLGFTTALGTYFSLNAKSTWRAQSTTIGVLVMASGGYMMCCLPVMFAGRASILIASGCTPMILGMSQIAPWEFFEYFVSDTPRFGPRGELAEAIMTCVLGTIGYGMAAFFLATASITGFDRAADRPSRGEIYFVPPPPEVPEKGKASRELA